MTRLVRFERDDASDAVIINPAHVRYIEDAPRSKRDRQPMTRLHMDGGEPLVVRGEMDMVAKTPGKLKLHWCGGPSPRGEPARAQARHRQPEPAAIAPSGGAAGASGRSGPALDHAACGCRGHPPARLDVQGPITGVPLTAQRPISTAFPGIFAEIGSLSPGDFASKSARITLVLPSMYPCKMTDRPCAAVALHRDSQDGNHSCGSPRRWRAPEWAPAWSAAWSAAWSSACLTRPGSPRHYRSGKPWS